MKKTKNLKRNLRRLLPRRRLQPLFERLHGWAVVGMGIGTAVWAPEESGEQHFVRAFASWKTDDDKPLICIDAGANNGSYARILAEELGDRGVIHCFEPSSETFAVLSLNLHDYGNCVLHNAGLGCNDGTATLHTIPGHSQLASLYEHDNQPESQSETVVTERLDTWAKHNNIRRIDLLKIDVEGAEMDVLKGCEELLARRAIDAIQFEFGWRSQLAGTRLKDFFDLLDGYVIHRMVVDGLRPMNEYRESLDLPISATNFVAIKRELRSP